MDSEYYSLEHHACTTGKVGITTFSFSSEIIGF
jgi:hypothetical protein